MSMQCSRQSWLACDAPSLASTEARSTFSCFRLLAWFVQLFQLSTVNFFFMMCFRRKAPMEQSWDTQEWQMSYVRQFRQMASKAFIGWAPPLTSLCICSHSLLFFQLLFRKVLLLWDNQAACMLECSQQWSGFLVVTSGVCSITCADMRGIAQCCWTCERVPTSGTLDG